MKKTSTLPPSLLNEIHTLNKAIIVTGAGISVNSGIPDFRSSNGLYKLKGKDMFDFSVLKNIDSASCFYSFMADLKSNILQATPSKTHLFIKFLLDSDKLLRCYTQNIDSLEVLLGLDCDLNNVDADVIQLHGDMDKVVCNICKSVFEFSEEYRVVYKNGSPPSCQFCTTQSKDRQDRGKRALQIGMLRPNIVLYNEPHANGDTIGHHVSIDLSKKPNLLIVMGTSLKVDGIKHLVKDVAKTVKSNGGVCILINRDPVGKEFDAFFDWFLEGDVDFFSTTIQDGIKELIEKENKSVKIEKKVVKVEKAVKEKSVKEETVKSVKIEKTVKAKIVKKVTKKAKKEPKNGKIEFPTQKAISRKENISG